MAKHELKGRPGSVGRDDTSHSNAGSSVSRTGCCACDQSLALDGMEETAVSADV